MSSKPTIAEMNRDLALFMGYNPKKYSGSDDEFFNVPDRLCYRVEDLLFHRQYEWLMPVWQKFRDIPSIGHPKESGFRLRRNEISNAILNKPITEAHRLIWEGVKWLETIKNK